MARIVARPSNLVADDLTVTRNADTGLTGAGFPEGRSRRVRRPRCRLCVYHSTALAIWFGPLKFIPAAAQKFQSKEVPSQFFNEAVLCEVIRGLAADLRPVAATAGLAC